MHFLDPARPQIGGERPCWLGCQIALPGLYFTPHSIPGKWMVELILDGSWVSRIIEIQDIKYLLVEWGLDPEAALLRWFGREPPRARGPTAQGRSALEVQIQIGSTSTSADDLDL